MLFHVVSQDGELGTQSAAPGQSGGRGEIGAGRALELLELTTREFKFVTFLPLPQLAHPDQHSRGEIHGLTT